MGRQRRTELGTTDKLLPFNGFIVGFIILSSAGFILSLELHSKPNWDYLNGFLKMILRFREITRSGYTVHLGFIFVSIKHNFIYVYLSYSGHYFNMYLIHIYFNIYNHQTTSFFSFLD